MGRGQAGHLWSFWVSLAWPSCSVLAIYHVAPSSAPPWEETVNIRSRCGGLNKLSLRKHYYYSPEYIVHLTTKDTCRLTSSPAPRPSVASTCPVSWLPSSLQSFHSCGGKPFSPSSTQTQPMEGKLIKVWHLLKTHILVGCATVGFETFIWIMKEQILEAVNMRQGSQGGAVLTCRLLSAISIFMRTSAWVKSRRLNLFLWDSRCCRVPSGRKSWRNDNVFMCSSSLLKCHVLHQVVKYINFNILQPGPLAAFILISIVK